MLLMLTVVLVAVPVALHAAHRTQDAHLAAIAAQQDPRLVEQIGGQQAVDQGLAQAADAFASTYWVALALVVVTFVAALFLPRKKEESRVAEDENEGAPPVIVH